MSSNHLYYQNPPFRVEDLSAASPLSAHSSMLAQRFAPVGDWHMHGQSAGYPDGTFTQYPAAERRSGHQRIPSGSTVASNGPVSPFQYTASYPHIATQDSWHSPASRESYNFDGDHGAIYPKPLPTPSYTPSPDYYYPQTYPNYQQKALHNNALAAHFALQQGLMEQQRRSSDEEAPGFSHSAGHSVSSYGPNPPTPHAGPAEETDERMFKVPSNGEIATTAVEDWLDKYLQTDDGPDYKPNVPKFDRTMSDIYQDELFNPAGRITSAPIQGPKIAPTSYLSPHSQVITSRLQEANKARSHSPTSVQRERSPFRHGSQLSPTSVPQQTTRSPRGRFNSAQQVREQQKAEADRRAYEAHHAMQEEDEPKTISPKEVSLEYNPSEEDEKTPLFPDGGAYGGEGYRDPSQGSYDRGGESQAYSGNSTSAPSRRQPSFTPTNANQGFTFVPPSIPGLPYDAQQYRAVGDTQHEPTPQFIPNLHTMSSTASDSGPDMTKGPAAQPPLTDSAALQKPAGAAADTGTFTCTYHGCTRRFESPAKLQKHKREEHRSQAHHSSSTTLLPVPVPASTTTPVPVSTDGPSTSPSSPSSSSPGPGPGPTSDPTSTSASSLPPHRQSQAGPHKCTRINPSTNKPCNTIFSRPYDLTRHEDTIHNARKQKVRCAYCAEEKSFSRNDALTRHMRVVHPEVEFGAGVSRMRRRQ